MIAQTSQGASALRHAHIPPPPSERWLIRNALLRRAGFHVIFGAGAEDFAARIRRYYGRHGLPVVTIAPGDVILAGLSHLYKSPNIRAPIFVVARDTCSPYHVRSLIAQCDVALFSDNGVSAFVTKGPAADTFDTTVDLRNIVL